jgi:ParB family chromosome partitioning protein
MENTNEAKPQAVTTQAGVCVNPNEVDSPDYARQVSPEGLDSLGADMEKNGQLQNVVLVKKSDGRYECVIGNRRVAAAKKRGFEKIRADVKENLTETQKLAIVVAENEEREDACPFYTAMLMERMYKASGQTQESFAEEQGKEPTVVSRYLTLAQVPAEVWKDHQSQLTSMRQCLEIAKVKDLEHQKKLAEACAKEGLSGAAAKKRAKALKAGQDSETHPEKEKEPQAPFTFAWKGNGILVKGRLFKPHAETFVGYTSEMSEAYDKFVEEERTKAKAA